MGKLTKLKKLNSKGLTLVEILAALALLSLVVTLAMTIFVSGKNAVDRQNSKANMQDSVTLAMKDITKQIRSAASVDSEENDDVLKANACELQFSNSNSTTLDANTDTDTYKYRFSDRKIYKNDVVLAENIKAVTFLKKSSLVLVKIESLDADVSLCSKILIRE